ncbi:hypothetical protein MAM1_0169c07127 [Mucor ambiguus]|uniref:DUF4097 domain-containing protein n=1 Tax=Mucor ambiguus TaxID=91626 RepID=A0A0C9LVZ3_9FUNG|nr:hypothetical protein MAM1_0169c07127 [Mucor ambiguus]
MSNQVDASASSTQGGQNSSNDNRVEPRFFGRPSIYENTAASSQKKDTNEPTENPYWANPPPPYSPPPNEPESSNSSVAMDPSAPPLELPLTPHIEHTTPQTQAPSTHITSPSSPISGHYSPLSYQNPQHSLAPQGYSQYGTVNQQQHPYANANSSVSDANLPIVNSWPWIAPPSSGRGTGSPQPPLVGYPLPLSPQSPLHQQQHYQPHYYNPIKKQKSCFEMFLKYVFYFFCICLVIRLIGLLSGSVNYADSCSHGFLWQSLPDRFTFNNGLKIRVVGGNLSGGHIVIKRVGDDSDVDKATTGIVKATALVSPASLADNPELSYSLTDLDNGSTSLEIYIPHDLSSRACISLNAVIYVPDTLELIMLEVQNTHIETSNEVLNIETVMLATTNSAFEFDAKWVGKVIQLKTSNAHIELNQPISNADDIVIETTNGGVRFRHPVTNLTEVVSVKTSNAGIDFDAPLEALEVQLITTNGHINLDSLDASRAELKSSNNRIELSRANISVGMNAQTSNGAVHIRLVGNNHAELIARTTNSQIDVILPAEHEGRFEVETSRNNRIQFIDPLSWSQLTYDSGYLIGTRYNPRNAEKPEGGHFQAKTSNADIHVHYADPDV